MDYGEMIHDAFAYARDGIFKNAGRWLRLILAIICLGIPLNGYVMRIYRGVQPAPDVDNWGTLFVDGIKLIIVGLIYAIPIIILWIIIYARMIMAVVSGDFTRVGPAMMSGWAPNLALLVVMYVIEIVIAIIVPIASIRFARTNSFSEAFNFGEIIGYIGKIGWLNYILALIIVALVIGIPVGILIFAFVLIAGVSLFALGASTVAILAWIIVLVLVLLIIMPLVSVFQARYVTRVYDSIKPAE
ncbi:MAG: DUF4013 domain-containing protein [Methanoregula sp.]